MAPRALRIRVRPWSAGAVAALCEPGAVESGVGQVESISAITLVTRDMAASTEFYDAVGFSMLYGGPTEPFTSYRAGSGFVNLQLDPRLAGRPRRSGVGWSSGSTTSMPCTQGASRPGSSRMTEPADAPWGERYFHLRDPDGHELSFARPLER